MTSAAPDFHSRQALLDHVRHTLAFYHPRAIDPSGGFYHFFKDDGTVFDAHTRHLVSSTRFVFVWAMAARHFPDTPAYLDNARRALAFLREAHRNPATGGYAWQLRWQDGRATLLDATNHCYGLAFVLLACAHALLAIEARRALPWLLPRAEALFDLAFRHAWDDAYGGVYYGFAPDFTICDDRKYHWVQCESLATAAVLGKRTGQSRYWDWYDRLWAYCWRHWIDHEHGAWFRLLTRENVGTSDEKSPAGKVDYHTTGACYAILPALDR